MKNRLEKFYKSKTAVLLPIVSFFVSWALSYVMINSTDCYSSCLFTGKFVDFIFILLMITIFIAIFGTLILWPKVRARQKQGKLQKIAYWTSIFAVILAILGHFTIFVIAFSDSVITEVLFASRFMHLISIALYTVFGTLFALSTLFKRT